MTEIKLWQFILDQLDKELPVVLMCVMESHGSSPGRRGFKMAVAYDEMCGSIGGGMMEYKFVELAKEKLNENQLNYTLKKQIHSKSAKVNQSGMICSGEQTVYLGMVNSTDRDSIHMLIGSLQRNQHGTLNISPTGISFGILPLNDDYFFEIKKEDEWHYKEKTGYKNILHIIGGGHCSLAFSELMSKLDFKICLYDDRPNLNTMTENNFVDSKLVLKSYDDLETLIESGENVYVVIMTFGYRSDNIALRAIVNKDFKYVGILGSQTKMDELFKEWEHDGISEKKLSKIHSPIGIKINSQTPFEIAVSIAGEVIAVKNKMKT